MRNPDFTQTDLFGGRGTVSIWNLTPALPPFSALLWCSLSGMGRVGPHRQQQHPEIVMCISGQGNIWIDKTKFEMLPMQAYPVPFGAVLAIENTQDEPLVYTITKAGT